MRALINSLLKIIGKDFTVSKDLKDQMILSVLVYKFFDLLRGYLLSLRLGGSKFPVFRGSGGEITFPKLISAGKALNIGSSVKINALSKNGIKIGDNFTIKSNSVIDCTGVYAELGEGLVIGDNVGISENCFLQVRGKVHISDGVILGPGVSIFSENHNFGGVLAVKDQGVSRKGVKISEGCWLGANSIVLDGVTLGKNCVVGAGSVVTKSFEDNTIIIGIPGKKIKNEE